MNNVEDQLRAALDERAEREPVDTTSLWYATNRRIQARRVRRPAVRWLLPAVGVGAVAVAAIGVPAVLRQPAEQTSELTPAATRGPATPTIPSSPRPPNWQHTFTDPSQDVVVDVEEHLGIDQIVPVDWLHTPDGDWLLFAWFSSTGQPDGIQRMCWRLLELDRMDGGGPCVQEGLPSHDPTAGNTWLSAGLEVDPDPDRNGPESKPPLRVVGGFAANRVANVVGIDDSGRRHQAKLVGKEQDWPNQQYFLVVEEPAKLVTIQAYDANGKLLGSVRQQDG